MPRVADMQTSPYRLTVEEQMARVEREWPEDERIRLPEINGLRLCFRAECGVEFEPKSSWQKYCCTECTPRGQISIKAKAKSAIGQICLHCGERFYTKSNSAKFCPSKPCAKQYYWLHHDLKNPNRKGN